MNISAKETSGQLDKTNVGQKGDRTALSKSRLPKFLIAALVAGVILIVVASLPVVTANTALDSIIRDLGIAALISGIVGSTLERASRALIIEDARRTQEAFHQLARNEIEAIRTEQTESTIRKMIPEPIWSQIQEFVLKSPILLGSLRWTIEISKHETDKDTVRLAITRKYDVNNASPGEVPYRIYHHEEKYHAAKKYPGSTKFTYVKVVEPDGKVKEFLEGKNMEAAIKDEEDIVSFHSDAVIPPKNKISVVARSETLYPVFGFYVIQVTRPADGMSIDVVLNGAQLTVNAEPLHPMRESFRKTSASNILFSWELDAGVFPYQGIEVWWHPPDSA